MSEEYGKSHAFRTLPLDHLRLPPRMLAALRKRKVHTIGQVMGMTVEDLLNLRMIGPGTIGAVCQAIDNSFEERLAALEADMKDMKERHETGRQRER